MRRCHQAKKTPCARIEQILKTSWTVKTASEEQQEWESEDNYGTLPADEHSQNRSSRKGRLQWLRSTRQQWLKQWGRRKWWWLQEWCPWLWRRLNWCCSCFYRLRREICRWAASYNTLRTSSNKKSWNWLFILWMRICLKQLYKFQLSFTKLREM